MIEPHHAFANERIHCGCNPCMRALTKELRRGAKMARLMGDEEKALKYRRAVRNVLKYEKTPEDEEPPDPPAL